MTEQGTKGSNQLVPSQTSDRALFTPKQEKGLAEIARIYARGKIVLKDKAALQKVGRIVEDALQRGLAAQGRSFLEPTENLRKFVVKGFEVREDLKARASSILDLSLRNQTTYNALVGPLAIPNSVVIACQSEIAKFSLNPDILATQHTVQLGETRLALIDPLAQKGLTELEQNGLNITLDQIPEIADRARLIRNTLASFAFRGHLSPIITTSDLRQFTILHRDSSPFNQDLTEQVVATFQLEEADAKEYVLDLFTQTSQSFRTLTEIPDESNPQSIMRFYRQFARDLLLLHPALEEQQLATNRLRVTDISTSIWNQGMKIGNLIIPRADQLAQAARQAEARKEEITQERLHQGIKAWQWLGEEHIKHEHKIASSKKNLYEIGKLIEKLNDPDFTLPTDAYRISRGNQTESKAVIAKRRTVEEIKRIIKENDALRTQVLLYEQELNRKYGPNSWPSQLTLPRFLYIQRLKDKEKIIRGRQAHIIKRLSATENFLHMDYLWSKQSNKGFGFLFEETSKDWVQEELMKTVQLKRQADRQPVQSITKDEARRIVGHLYPNLRLKVIPTYIPTELKPYYEFWHKTFTTLSETPHLATEPTFWANIVSEALQQRISLLNFADSVLEAKERLPEQATKARLIVEEYLNDPNKALPKNVFWTNIAAHEYILETKLITLPDTEQVPEEKLLETASEIRFLLRSLPASFLPKTIPTKEKLQDWIDNNIKVLNESLAKKKMDQEQKKKKSFVESQEITSLESMIHTYNKLKALVESPVTPLPGTEGLKASQFRKIWRKRADYIWAVYYQEEAEEEKIKSQEEYQKVVKENYRKRLIALQGIRQKSLADLKARDLEQEFLERMSDLNLVLEENPLA